MGPCDSWVFAVNKQRPELWDRDFKNHTAALGLGLHLTFVPYEFQTCLNVRLFPPRPDVKSSPSSIKAHPSGLTLTPDLSGDRFLSTLWEDSIRRGVPEAGKCCPVHPNSDAELSERKMCPSCHSSSRGHNSIQV